MTVSVGPIDKDEVRRLIYSDGASTLSSNDIRALDHCLMMTSQMWVGSVDRVMLCAWGLIPPTLMSDQAYLWLYTTEKVQDYLFVFVRHSQRAVEAMLKEYPTIVGHASVDNERGIRWLKWLGAVFGDPQGKAIPFMIKAKL